MAKPILVEGDPVYDSNSKLGLQVMGIMTVLNPGRTKYLNYESNY